MNTTDINKFISEKKLNNVFNSEHTVRSYYKKLLTWHKFSVGNDDIETARKYLELLVSVYDSKTTKTTLYVLKSFYDWLGTEPNPFVRLVSQFQINKKESNLKRLERDLYVYSDSDINRLLAKAKAIINEQDYSTVDYYIAYRNWFIILMMSEYGMRIGGLMGTDVNHINFERRLLTIYDSKNGRPYPVPAKEALNSLKGYLNVRNTTFPAISGNALFLSKSGIRLSDTSARRAVNTIASEIGLYDSGRSTHQLRHFRATKYYKEGMPMDLISQIMGVSVDVLKRVYLHMTDDDTIRQYERWVDFKKADSNFSCPRCGYSSDEKQIVKPKLEMIK